jgi:hypothetical protein
MRTEYCVRYSLFGGEIVVLKKKATFPLGFGGVQDIQYKHFTFCTGSTKPWPFNARCSHMRQYGKIEKKTLDPAITTYLWT